MQHTSMVTVWAHAKCKIGYMVSWHKNGDYLNICIHQDSIASDVVMKNKFIWHKITVMLWIIAKFTLTSTCCLPGGLHVGCMVTFFNTTSIEIICCVYEDQQEISRITGPILYLLVLILYILNAESKYGYDIEQYCRTMPNWPVHQYLIYLYKVIWWILAWKLWIIPKRNVLILVHGMT